MKEDLAEQKEERRKDHETLNNKLRSAETAKAELAAREETIRESLAVALKEKEQSELKAEEKMNIERKEKTRQIQELTEKMNIAFEE